jgi:hypothetical protein
MRPTVYLALVPLLGCNTDDGNWSLFADPYAYADLYTDGSRLDVVGCPTSAIIGCSPYAPQGGDSMALIVDGATVPVPVATSSLPQIIDSMAGLFHDGPFGMSTTLPIGGRLAVELATATGSSTAAVILPTPPPLYAPPHVSRSQPVTIRHDVLAGPNDEILVIVRTTCTAGGGGEFGDVEKVAGEDALDLTKLVPAGATTCTHEVHVDQIVDLAELPDLPTRAIAISTAAITSDP